jgi:cyclophilin family peptidyl-prolyl cis-trans isomerase
MRRLVLSTALILVACLGLQAQRRGAPAQPAGPIMTIETPKGVITIELFRKDAPKSVDHIVALVNRHFYRGQRIHRAEAGLVQFGDPTSRNVAMRDWWGRAGSGSAIGVAEFNAHKHVRGAVALAHSGDARYADSQIYILKRASPSLDGKHVVIGQVTSGMAVVDRLVVTDLLKTVTITEAGRK